MNNKSWKILYEEIVQKIQKIDAEQKKEVENQTENINIMISNIQTLKDELIQQLENQEVENIDKNAKIRDLIKRIEDIEGGGGDYNSFFEYVERFDRNFQSDGRDMEGEFPPCPNLKSISSSTFRDAKFTGEFPLLPNLESIGQSVFVNSVFTGEFPLMENLKIIDFNSFKNSKFTGNFPPLPKLENIDWYVFENSKFTDSFPSLPNLKKIGNIAFYSSVFTGEFPLMENLESIGTNAFGNSKFDKDEDGFVKNYPGWNGKTAWNKPSSYRAAMKNIDAPKLMSIIPPGAGEIQVLNEEAKLAQSIRRDEYLEENEPSDIDYYISYTKKLKEIGFERDEYGNYIDMINDKSVIIIPEDIKFLV